MTNKNKGVFLMNIKKISIVITILFSLILLTGCGGGGGSTNLYNVTITGHVKDFLSGQPIEGASIYIDSNYMDTTNLYGNYQFDQLIKNSASLTIRKQGYIPKSKTIIPTGDGEMIIPNIRLMDSYEFSGSISGNIILGNISALSNTNPYNDIKVMATIKVDDTYYIVSDISNVNADGNYYINHAKIEELLTVIGFIDSNNNDIIDHDEFFGEHYNPASPVYLKPYQDIHGVDIFMTPNSNSLKNKKIIKKRSLRGE